jgi:MFS family permease
MSSPIFLLFATRALRMFAYGMLSVILLLYLSALGHQPRAGLLLTLTLVGDIFVSLYLTTSADRHGRKRTLLIGALLMVLAGAAFATSANFWVLLTAATIGVISPSATDIGPFLAVEQSSLSQIIPAERRTRLFAWYNLAGSLAAATGSLAAGVIADLAEHGLKLTGPAIHKPVIVIYGLVGLAMAALFFRLSPAVEAPPSDQPGRSLFGLHRSHRVVARLSALFALDAFGGGFVVQSILAAWFKYRFDMEYTTLGGIFFLANVLAGFSGLAAASLAGRIGLINTMVFTHLPSNILLILVPLMPNLPLAVLLLWLRFAISQMDVPTRQSYVMAVVAPDERSAASGITGIARSIGVALSPWLATYLVRQPGLAGGIFFIAGGAKIIYDLLLYWSFVSVKPEEEHRPS